MTQVIHERREKEISFFQLFKRQFWNLKNFNFSFTSFKKWLKFFFISIIQKHDIMIFIWKKATKDFLEIERELDIEFEALAKSGKTFYCLSKGFALFVDVVKSDNFNRTLKRKITREKNATSRKTNRSIPIE